MITPIHSPQFGSSASSPSNISSDQLLNFYQRQGIVPPTNKRNAPVVTLHDSRLGTPVKIPTHEKQVPNKLLKDHARALGMTINDFKRILANKHSRFSLEG